MAEQEVTVFLGLGSNLGDRWRNIVRAIDLLGRKVRIEQVSGLYESPPLGEEYKGHPHFFNAVVKGTTLLEAEALLAFCQGIERTLGRVHPSPHAPRTIDIDILLYGDKQITGESLTIPHPRLAKRAFALAPLAELSPDLVAPGAGETVAALLERAEGKDTLKRLGKLAAPAA